MATGINGLIRTFGRPSWVVLGLSEALPWDGGGGHVPGLDEPQHVTPQYAGNDVLDDIVEAHGETAHDVVRCAHSDVDKMVDRGSSRRPELAGHQEQHEIP